MSQQNLFGTRTGNHIEIRMDNKVVGLIQNLRGSDDYGLEPVSGIGDIHCKEYVPTMARHQVSCGLVAMRRASLTGQASIDFGDNDFIPANGGEALNGLVFDIIIYDKNGGGAGDVDGEGSAAAQTNSSVAPSALGSVGVGTVIKHYHDCSYASGDFSIDAHRVIIRNAQFMALTTSGRL